MTWVLILTPGHNAPPAVIGGYSTLLEARAAGISAIRFEVISESEERPLGKVNIPAHTRFTVIAGAANSGPSTTVHGHSWFEAYPNKAYLEVWET